MGIEQRQVNNYKIFGMLDVVMYTCNSGTWEMEHEGQEFKASLGYTVSLGPACAT